MKALRIAILLLLLPLAAGLIAGCQTDLVTGEQEFNLYNVEDDIRMGQAYMEEFLEASRKENWMPDDEQSWAMQRKCEQIMQHLVPMTHGADVFPWKIYYTKNPTPNAFCLPGGQIMVFQGLFKRFNPETGLVSVSNEDAELAAVIAHEMGHACARHGTENVSKAYVAQIALLAVVVAAAGSGDSSAAQTADAMNQALATIFPAFSREAEQEADILGTTYMAMAGYNPQAAVSIWQRIAAENPGGTTIYDSHPHASVRAEYLEQIMPNLDQVYHKALTGTDYSLPANKSTVFNYIGNPDKKPAVMLSNAGIPADMVKNFSYQPNVVDTTNYWWDHELNRLTVRVFNNTNKDIEDYTLQITFFDAVGNTLETKDIRQKNDLDKRKYHDIAIPAPAGADRAEWKIINLKWD